MKPVDQTPRRRLHSVALTLLLIAVAPRSLSAELPSAPTPQSPAESSPAATGSIGGYITDSDGDSIAGARVTLTRDGQPGSAASIAVTASDGRFSFPDVPPGPFKLSTAAAGFSPQATSSELHPGEAFEIPAIALNPAASATTVEVTATQAEIAQAQVQEEEKQRVLGVIPNFYVSYIPNPVPLTPKQKYELALKTAIDPVSFVLNGITAGAQQAANVYDWGQGWPAFGKRYAAAYGTFLNADLLGNAVLPILFKQDPRYYYKGTGSISARAGYAIANAVVCKGDNHHWQFNYSGYLGGLAASGISNAYYPAANRAGAAPIFEGAALGTGINAVANLIQEFLIRKLTPHIPPNPPATP
jgi:hypothetical protein